MLRDDFARIPELLALAPPPQPGEAEERPALPEPRALPDVPELEPVAVAVDDRQMGLF